MKTADSAHSADSADSVHSVHLPPPTVDAGTGGGGAAAAVFAAGAGDTPSMPAAPEQVADPETLRGLRQFHFTGSSEHLAAIEPGSLLPALMFPYRDPSRVRSDYPLFLAAEPAADQPSCRPLSVVLRQAMIDAGASQVLIDNRTRLELGVHRAMGDATAPQPADEIVAAAAAALQQALHLRGDSATRLDRDLAAMVEQLPARGELLTASTDAPIHLFITTARQILGPRRAAFTRRVEQLCARLEALLLVERGKDLDAHDAAHLGAAVGAAGAGLLDPARLAQVIGAHRGSTVMAREHRQLVEDARRRLRQHLDAEAPVTACVLGPGVAALTADPDVVWYDVADVCIAGAIQFDAIAHEWTEVFRAVRRARLLQRPDYDPARHDAWADTFGWESFSAEELHLLPCVLAVDPRPGFDPAELPELSQLLLSGRHVHLMLTQDPLRDPTSGEAAGAQYRLELAYLAMAHREAFVQQATAARPDQLMAGLRQAIAGTRAALTVVDRQAPLAVGGWLHSRAAVEARAHPLFRYDPEAGASWARRLDIGGNPAVGDDWSAQALAFADEDGADRQLQLAFTYADLSLLDHSQAAAFLSIPRGLASDDLLPLSEYLALPDEVALHRLPFLWAVDLNGELRRVLLTFRLMRATRERMGFWRSLQDLAGVRSEAVQRAVAEAEAKAAARFAAETQQLVASHDAALAEVRNAAATDAMQGLARMLLDTDTGSFADLTLAPAPAPAPAPQAAPTPATPTGAPATPAAAPEAQATEATEAAEPAAEPAVEPWVETVLCTSCNDCVTINNRLFVYDENKQVYLGDAKAGTYRQLVEAAEKCPARCIHPGLPLDPAEPGSDELRARAAPFN